MKKSENVRERERSQVVYSKQPKLGLTQERERKRERERGERERRAIVCVHV